MTQIYRVSPAYDDDRYFSTAQRAHDYVAELTKRAKEFQDERGNKLRKRTAISIGYWDEQFENNTDVLLSYLTPEWSGADHREIWEVESIVITRIKVDEDD